MKTNILLTGIFLSILFPALLKAQNFYAIDADGSNVFLSQTELSNGSKSYTQTISMESYDLVDFGGMTYDASLDEHFGVFKDADGNSHLAIIDIETAIAQPVGVLAFECLSLTSDNYGTLYGIGENETADLYMINPQTAESDFLFAFSPEAPGEIIEYYDTQEGILRYAGGEAGMLDIYYPNDGTHINISKLTDMSLGGGAMSYDISDDRFVITGGAVLYYVYPICCGGPIVEELVVSDYAQGIKGLEPVRYRVDFEIDNTLPIANGSFNPDQDVLYITGTFSGWEKPGFPTTFVPEDSDADGIYNVTVKLPADEYMYQYYKNSGWLNGEDISQLRVLSVEDEDVMVQDVIADNAWTLTRRDELSPKISVYPNPSDGEFFVNSDVKLKMQIFDISGRIIQEKYVNGKDIIQIEQSGMYFLNFSDGRNLTKYKLIIR